MQLQTSQCALEAEIEVLLEALGGKFILYILTPSDLTTQKATRVLVNHTRSNRRPSLFQLRVGFARFEPPTHLSDVVSANTPLIVIDMGSE